MPDPSTAASRAALTPGETMTEQTDTQTPPLPAPGAPHAYVAVQRTNSPHADHPEWYRKADVIPAWDARGLDCAIACGLHLLPIGPDGDDGTRWVTEEPDEATERADLTRKWRRASEAARKAEHHFPADCLVEAADVLDGIPQDWRSPARVITTLAEMDELPYGAVVRCRTAIYQHCGYGQWLMPGGHPRAHSLRLLQWAAEAGADLVLLFDPRQEGQADA